MNLFRILGRALSSFLLILILALVIGEGLAVGLPLDIPASSRELWLFAFLGLSVLGMLHSWRNELQGGALTLLGGLLFLALNSIPEGELRGGWVFYAILLAGLFFLASHWIERRQPA